MTPSPPATHASGHRLVWLAPLLLSLHSPLFLFSRNIEAVLLRETGVALAVALGIGVAALAVAWPLCRSRDRAVCLACGLVGWCIWYAGFAYWLATALGIGPMAGGSTHIGIALWTLGWLVYAVAIVRGFATRVLAPAWLVVSIALVAMPAITLVTFPFRAAPPTAPLPTIPLRAEAAPPDIYYLVFDRYGSPETIRERYGFDTAPFLAELRRRGFHVAERSNANYFKTALSLASSLNLTYVNEIYAGLRESRDLRPMYTLVEEHRVGRSLRAVGYDYLHLGAWWEPTRENRHATENLSFTPVSLFLHSAYVHTPLVEAGFTAGGLLDLRRQQWNRVHRQLKVIASSRARERPVFAFAHFLLPHDPWVFGPEGEYLPANVVERRSRTENYVNHLRFANRAILRLVDSLLADRRRPQPIIIVQADEGPFPLRYERDELNFDWRQATPEEVREKFGILNALYLPGVATERLSSSITPVNTFRLVFGSYFGADLPLLEDRIYVSAGNFAPYDFVDVTDIVMPPAKK